MDARELTAGDKLLEAESAIEILINASKCISVVAELLFNAHVNLLHELLNVLSFGRRVRFHHQFRLVELLVLVLLI